MQRVPYAPAPRSKVVPGPPHRMPTVLFVQAGTTAPTELLAYLQQQGVQMHITCSPHKVLAQVRELMPDLILLHLTLMDQHGWSVLRQLAADPLLAIIPVIFLSELSETSARLTGLFAGAVDYIKLPCLDEEVWLRLCIHWNLRRARQMAEFRNLWLQLELLELLERTTSPQDAP